MKLPQLACMPEIWYTLQLIACDGCGTTHVCVLCVIMRVNVCEGVRVAVMGLSGKTVGNPGRHGPWKGCVHPDIQSVCKKEWVRGQRC